MAIALSNEPLKITQKALAAETALARVGCDITELESDAAQQQVANNVIIKLVDKMFRLEDFDFIPSKSYVAYLESMSLEKCKEVLAWNNWNSRSMKIDSDHARIDNDWYTANECLTRIARLRPTALSDHSVRSYLDACLWPGNREDLVKKKAYWHHLACPGVTSSANFKIATEFVDEFYEWAKRAVGNPDGVDISRYQSKFSTIINMMEFLILRVKQVKEVEEGALNEQTREEAGKMRETNETRIATSLKEVEEMKLGTVAEAERISRTKRD
jgi:hypothetical protein